MQIFHKVQSIKMPVETTKMYVQRVCSYGEDQKNLEVVVQNDPKLEGLGMLFSTDEVKSSHPHGSQSLLYTIYPSATLLGPYVPILFYFFNRKKKNLEVRWTGISVEWTL